MIGIARLALVLAVTAAPAAAGAAPRMAIVVGSNAGAGADPPLRYAERDARRVAEALRDVGGVARADLTLLTGADVATVQRALRDARRRAVAVPGAMLLVYYSGHAGLDGLHVSGAVLPWAELRELADVDGEDLRIVLVDACHAGALARAKGFVAVPPEELESASRGAAVLAAAEWFEAAQESDALGGSFFTHALVSGLRGAADADGDGRVTLGELHAYVSRDTSARTATTGVVQHPTYRFDIAGRGDVVLGRLREGDARVVLAEPLEGDVVVLERDSSSVLVETRKRAGAPLTFALPKGRYQVLVRGEGRVGVAEITLPWGGERRLGPGDVSPRSYQDVVLKGGVVDVRRHRLRVGPSLETPLLEGMGLVPSIGLAAGRKLARLELGARAAAGRRRFDAVDTAITATFVEAGAFAALAWPRRRWDLRAWAAVDLARMWQEVEDSGARAGFIPAAAVGLGAQVPLDQRIFVEAGLEGRVLVPELEERGRAPRLGLRAELRIGWAL
jgi:hypothetical protein